MVAVEARGNVDGQADRHRALGWGEEQEERTATAPMASPLNQELAGRNVFVLSDSGMLS